MRNSVTGLFIVTLCLLVGCGPTETAQSSFDSDPSVSSGFSSNAKSLGRSGGPADAGQDNTADAGEDAADAASDANASGDGAADASSDAAADPPAATTPAAPPAAAANPFRRQSKALAFSGGGNLGSGAGTADANDSGTSPNQPPANAPPANPPTNDTNVAANQPAQPIEPPKPTRETFFERAVKAFIDSHDNEAFQYLYAHALTEDGALRDHPIAYYEGIQEPRLGLRIGVGVTYSPGRFDGDPPLIGDPVDDSGGGRGGARGGGGGGADSLGGGSGGARGGASGGAASVSGSGGRTGAFAGSRNLGGDGGAAGGFGGAASSAPDPTEELIRYTGDFGAKFVERSEMRRSHAYFGEALKDVDLSATFDSGNSSDSGAPAAGNFGNPGDDTASISGGNDTATISGGSRTAGGGRGNRNRGGNSSNASNQPAYQADPTSLSPGVMMLGVNNKADLFEDAQSNGLDLLVIFDVSVNHSTRLDKTTTSAKARLYKVDDSASPLATTKALTNTAVWKARQAGDKDDPVEIELDKIFKEVVDISYKASAMTVDASAGVSDAVKQFVDQRIDVILARGSENPLPGMVEIKHYFEVGVLTKAEMANAFEQLIGADRTRDLIDGEIEAREKAINDWLPGQFKVVTSNNFR